MTDPKQQAENQPDEQPEADEIELDEEQDEESPAGDDQPAGDEGDEAEEAADEGYDDQPEDAEQDDELPDDPKVLKALLRQQSQFLQNAQPPRPAPATDREEEVDPFIEDVKAVVQDRTIPLGIRKVLYGMTQRLAQADNEARVARREASRTATEASALKIPEEHRRDVMEIATQFGIPLNVAYQLHKGELYDKEQTRRAGRAAPPARRPTPPAAPQGSTRRTGSAQHTVTRPVRPGPAPSGDGAGPAVVVSGMRVPKEFKSAAEYSRFMDGLPSDKHRAIVLKLRKDGRAARFGS